MESKQYELRGILSKNRLIITLFFWVILFFCVFIIMIILYPNKNNNLIVTAGIFGFSFGISILLLIPICYFLLSSKCNIILNSNEIILYKKKKKIIIPITKIVKTEFGTSKKIRNLTFLYIYWENKTDFIFAGFVFTFNKEVNLLKDFYFNHFRNLMLANAFINEDTAKIKTGENFAEKFIPTNKNK